MADLNPFARQPGRSPFDAIRRTDTDPERGDFEYWSAREAMQPLGYSRWENLQNVIRKAKAACRNSGNDPAEHFRDITKTLPQGGPPSADTQMTRFGMYLLAMNGDPDKPEIAAAQRYFAVQTYRAEQQLPPTPVLPPPPPPTLARPWHDRIRETWAPHAALVESDFPGFFTVASVLIWQGMQLEDEALRHAFMVQSSDRPDVSVGRRYSIHRETLGLPEATAAAPLFLPDQGITVYLKVYPDRELPEFRRWFRDVYMPELFLKYADGKKEWKVAPPTARASLADAACRTVVGRPASLPAPRRAALVAAGGFAPARALPGHPPSPPSLGP
ncbi:MAG: hypothetical protein U0871_29635 [Gemmataceae bacterium]